MTGKEEKEIRRCSATPISLSSPHKDNLTKFLTNNIKSCLWISNCKFWISKEKPYEGKMLTNNISHQCKLKLYFGKENGYWAFDKNNDK